VSQVVAALDIGGTHVSAARVNIASAAVEPGSGCRIPYRPDGSRGELLEAILRAAAATGTGVQKCGVAVPGPFDYENGVCTIRGVGKLEALYGVDLRHELGIALGLGGAAVRFLNDADAFLLGEWWAGAAYGHARAVGLTLGTGLGSAFLEHGRIVDDRSDVPPEGSLHLVPFRGGPVEDVISRRGLLAFYGLAADGELDVADVAERAHAGERRAREAFFHFGSALAEFVTPWVRSFSPTSVVVGGSIARAWDLIGPVLEAELAAARGLEVITRAKNLDDAPLLGAAHHAAA
jgi:glucokinase